MARLQLGAPPSRTRDVAEYGTSGGGGGVWSPPALLTEGGMKVANIADPYAIRNEQFEMNQNTTYVQRLYAPVTLTASQVFYWFVGKPSSPSGQYFAIYGANAALISGSRSVDVSSLIQDKLMKFALGSTISIPAGYFYVAFHTGTWVSDTLRVLQTTGHYMNGGALTSSTNPTNPAQCVRNGSLNGAWSGGTPPATLGTNLNEVYAGIPAAVG